VHSKVREHGERSGEKVRLEDSAKNQKKVDEDIGLALSRGARRARN